MYYKKRIFNVRNFVTILLVFLISIATYFFVLIFPTLTMDTTKHIEGAQSLLLSQVLTWPFVKYGTVVVFNLYPIFSFLPLLSFREDWLSHFTFGFHRFQSFNRELFKKIIFYSLLLSTLLFLGHVLYYTFMIPFVIDPTWGFGEMLTADFLPIGTFDQYGYLYLIVEAFLVNFIGGLTFAIMNIAIILWTTNLYWIFFIPLVYYYGSMNAYLLFSTPDNIREYLSIYNFLSGDLALHRGFLHALIPLTISGLSIFFALKKEKRGGVHAN